MSTLYDSGHEPEILVHHRLRIARETAGLEQDELAKAIGISRNTVSNAENGRVKPRKITLNAWALACGVPVSWIELGPQVKVPAGDKSPAHSNLPDHPTVGYQEEAA